MVKAYRFLDQGFKKLSSKRDSENNQTFENEHTALVYTKYQAKLHRIINGFLLWLLSLPSGDDTAGGKPYPEEYDMYRTIRPISYTNKAFFRLRRWHQDSPTYYELDREDFSSWNPSWQTACFHAITIYYIISHCPEVGNRTLSDFSLWKNIQNLYIARLPREAESKTVLLQWYHSFCLSGLLKKLQRQLLPDGPESQYISYLERLSARLVRLSQKSQPNLYSAKDGEIDELLLIHGELVLEDPSLIFSLEALQSKIERRLPTTVINPGFTSSKSTSSTEPPWELFCSNHHTALKLAIELADDSDLKSSMQACLEFLLTDYSFTPTWDRSRVDMTEQWWDMDMSSMICATFLDSKGPHRGKTKLCAMFRVRTNIFKRRHSLLEQKF